MYYEFHTEPYKHQLRALKLALKKNNLGLLMEPGCGKTKPAIDYIGCRYLKNNHTRVLVIVPKSIIGVWEEEIETHLPPSIERTVVRLEGPKRKKLITQHMKPTGLTIFIISYDSAWRTKKELIKWNPQGVIADESHYIAGATSKRSKGARAIRKNAEWASILTGTFLPNGPLNAYAQLNFLNPDTFPMSWTKFKQKYAEWIRLSGYMKLKRYKRLPELQKIIAKHSIIVRKKEALDLPKRTNQTIPVEMSAKAWRYYKEMKKEKLVEFNQGDATAEIILTEMLRFQQITSGFITVETGEYDHRDRPIKEEVDIHEDKIKALLEIIDIHISHGEKIVVFTRFKWDINHIVAALKKKKIKHAFIDGRVKNTDRDIIRRDFQKGQYDVIVINIATGGVGITLTAANVGIFYSTTQQYDQFQQAKDRIHRPGQTKPVTYYHLIVKGTIDEAIRQSNRNKKNLADSITPSNWSKFI